MRRIPRAYRGAPAQDIPAREAEYREWNRRRPSPLAECDQCHFPTLEGDWGIFFRGLCQMCEGRRLDEMMQAAARRLGRQGFIDALVALASGK